MTAAVIVCSYQRPADLGHCLDALARQTRLPDQVIVVVRDADAATRVFVHSYRNSTSLPLQLELIDEPGLVAARNRGLRACRCDVVSFIDDDTRPHPDWMGRIVEHFAADPQLGGLGGRDRCGDGVRFDEGHRDEVAKLRWYGRLDGFHHQGYGTAREADHLKGANMSYRRAAIGNLEFDVRLRGKGSQPFDDTTFSLAVRRGGWKLLYDPQVLLDHVEGARTETRYYSCTVPVTDVQAFQNMAFNNVVALWDELSPLRMTAFALWSLFVGVRVCPGLVQAVRFTPSLGLKASFFRFWVAQQGFWKAYRTLPRSDNKVNLSNGGTMLPLVAGSGVRTEENSPQITEHRLRFGDFVPGGTVAVCICTRNRPLPLQQALTAMRASSVKPDQIVVSDDSTDSETRELVTREFPEVTLTEGPREGLAINRNHALRHLATTHVLFIDDDATLSPHFLERVARHLAASPGSAESVIVTGTEINRGLRVFPHKQTFLGFQSVDYSKSEQLHTIVINSTVFPASTFQKLQFDENLVYGYEELDIAIRAVYLAGLEIQLLRDAANDHEPSDLNRDFYVPYVEASRIYVTFKKYKYLERKQMKALGFLAVAYLHNLAFNLKNYRMQGFRNFGATLRNSVRYLRRCLENPTAFLSKAST